MKYGDEALVKDLIARRTALNQFEKNPDFPDNEDVSIIACVNMSSG